MSRDPLRRPGAPDRRDPYGERPDPDRPGRLRRTQPRALLFAALVGALIGWLVVSSADAFGWSVPVVPWLTPIALWLGAVVVAALAWALRRRIRVRRLPIDPSQAVTALALAKASALVGALIAAGYLVFAALFLDRWQAELPHERVVRGGVAALAGLGLMVAGLLMERACEVPPPEDDRQQPDR